MIAFFGLATLLVLQISAPKPTAPASADAYGTLTPQQLADRLQKKDFTFINVHIPYEGEIDRTDAFIPYDKISENLAKLPAQKNAKIILYCRSGAMSASAAEELAKRGYTNVSHLGGGMNAWRAAGHEVANRPQ